MLGASIQFLASIAMPISYVGLLYVFDKDGIDRNDPKSVRLRFTAAFVSSAASLILTYVLLFPWDPHPLRTMGIHLDGSFAAVLIPSFLIFLIYAGHLLIMYYDQLLDSYLDINQWKYSFSQITWIRDAIVAPATEEITFRGCAATLMASALQSQWLAILLSPLAFSVSHFHHIGDDQRKGATLNQAIAKRVFQMLYTYLFGAYATYLHQSTGHILAPIVTHSLCNSLGIPMVSEIQTFPDAETRKKLWLTFIFGAICFVLLVGPLTHKSLYSS
ncbi:hypothetical protein WR25_15743 [Diploscapter pachys]|uniref:CAAX prenyl protease 2 n=1 Tax=Diploscapter pachys TaxID=2018661 RepID=A0A2A2KYS0_9BILA|nr:hypothetical protein WR25_15743 [Diploscapter pachys]